MVCRSARIAGLLCLLASMPVIARPPAESANLYYEAYYRETANADPAGAAELYAEFIKSPGAPKELVAQAEERLAGCREDVRSSDLAALAPPQALAFIELRNPGEHLDRLAGMLGLAGDPLSNIGAAAKPIPNAPGIVLPAHVMISRKLLGEAKLFRGAALAITNMSGPEPKPEGVFILHPGKAVSLRGILETGAQFVQADEPISGFPAVRVQAPDFAAVIAFTHRLVITATSRELVGEVVERLQSESAPSLATSEAFRAHAGQRDNSLFYVFVNAPPILRIAEERLRGHPHDMRDFAMARALCDLDHVQGASLAIGAAPDALQAELAVSFSEGQASLVYNLLRLPPMRGEALAHVPAGAAAVLAVGVNPGDAAAPAPMAGALTAVTGLDLGREVFANLRETAVFVLPPSEAAAKTPRPIPDVGVVLTVADAARSEALWTLLLSLPGRFAGPQPIEPESLNIEGVAARAYALPDGVKVYFARPEGAIVMASSPAVIAQAVKCSRGSSVLEDSGFRDASKMVGADTSIALWLHGGRLAGVASQFAPPTERAKLRLIADAARDTVASLAIEETTAHFHVRTRLSGLPQIDQVISLLEQAGALGRHEAREPLHDAVVGDAD